MALDLLRSEGLVRRLQGIGTMAVDNGKIRVPLDPPRSVAKICDDGTHPVRYFGLSALVVASSSSIAEHLEITPGELVAFIERLTLIDSRPASVASVWIPLSIAGPVVSGNVDLDQYGIFDILEQELHLELGVSEYSIEATLADEAITALLEVAAGSPVVLLGTLTRLADGRPAALTYTRGRGDRVRYEFGASRHPHAGCPDTRQGCHRT
jgi:GntR family transcriptional regulator